MELLNKLDEGLRHEINHQNSLSVIKSSIFFLCHWSKHLQSEVAKLLERRIFAPNEMLNTLDATKRLYIIKNGSVSVMMSLDGSHKKNMKIININQGSEVSNNVYGYTSVFSNRPVRLEASAREFTSTYSIGKQSFVNCVGKNIHDREYYH